MKIKNLLMIFILTNSLHIYSDEQVEVKSGGIWQRIKNAYNAIKEDRGLRYVSSFYGDADLSAENELYIRNLLKKLGIEDVDSIKIKRLSKIAQYNGMGEKNACAVGTIGLPRYIFVNEQWLNTLSNEAKDFLIAHEAMHLKYNHLNKRLALQTYVLGSFLGWFITYIDIGRSLGVDYKGNYYIHDEEKFKSILPAFIIASGMSLIGIVGMLRLSHSQEHEADAQAAILLQTTAGAEKLFEEFEQYENELDAELPQREDLKEARRSFKEQHSTHPKNADRIAHVQKELEKHRAQKEVAQK